MNTEEIYLTKEELVQYLEDHKINSIRIVSEGEGQLKANPKTKRKRGPKYIPCKSAMIEIVTTGKVQKEGKGWQVDSTRPQDKWDTTLVTSGRIEPQDINDIIY